MGSTAGFLCLIRRSDLAPVNNLKPQRILPLTAGVFSELLVRNTNMAQAKTRLGKGRREGARLARHSLMSYFTVAPRQATWPTGSSEQGGLRLSREDGGSAA